MHLWPSDDSADLMNGNFHSVYELLEEITEIILVVLSVCPDLR